MTSTPVVAYVGAVVLTAGPGALMIANRLHQRVVWVQQRSVAACYTIVTSVIALAGCALWPAYVTSTPAGWQLIAAVPGTAVLAWSAIAVDGAVSRKFSRTRRAVLTAGERRLVARPPAAVRVRPAGVAAQTSRGRGHGQADEPSSHRQRDSRSWSTSGWLLAVAIGEELLYRGAVLGLASTLPVAGAVTVIAAGSLAFAAVHVGFGWVQVGAKLSLSVATTAATLLLGSVLPAIVIHGLLNLHYWRQRSIMAVSAAGTIWNS